MLNGLISRRAWQIALVATILLGCSDGSDGGDGTATAGIDGSGSPSAIVTQGPIEGFGSIVVGGRHYDLGSADIRVNGAPAGEADLALGQVVTVAGTLDDAAGRGAARSVVSESNVRGPIDAIDLEAGTLALLGQSVATDAATVLDAGSGAGATALADFSVGQTVEISGYAGSDGSVHATRIALGDATAPLRVRGIARNVDSGSFLVNLGNLTVDYSGASVITGFDDGGPDDGDEIAVEGATLDTQGVLIADSLLLLENRVSSSDGGDGAEVEGLITRFASPADFDVSGLAATVGADTDFEGGTAADLRLNVKVKVVGVIDGAGVIVADKVEVKNGGRVAGED